MKKVRCNGVMLNYRCVGEGSDVVLIHGLAANHAFWRLDVLLSLAKKHRVTIYDLRGHGYSEMPRQGYTSMDMAEDLHQLLTHLNITQAHLIGHSLGGVLALHYAVLHPERVSSLVIADSRIRVLQPTNYSRDWPNWEKAGKKLKEIGLYVPETEAESGLWLLEQIASSKWQKMRHKLEGTSLFVPFGGWNGGQKTAERWLELMQTTTARQDFLSLSGLTIERLSQIRKPVLAMYGQNSPTIVSMHGLQAYLPECETAIVEGAGHFFPLTKPRIFIELNNQFLNELEEVQKC